jgi:hypothetical protein
MQLEYSNPVALIRKKDPLYAMFKATHDLKIGDFQISWLKDVNLPKISVLDVLNGVTNALLYPSTFANTGWAYTPSSQLTLYKDPVLDFNLFKIFVVDWILGSANWYGANQYCNFNIAKWLH